MSPKSTPEKLLVKANTSVWVSDPARYALLEPLPPGVRRVADLGAAEVALVFADDARSLREVLDVERARLARPSVFWVAYPKANRTDVNRDSLWPILADYGLRPVSQVAVDEVWSALRFRPLKEGEEHPLGPGP